MHTDIEKWLESGSDFKTGVELYNKYGKDSFLKRFFTITSDNPFNRQKLIDQLTGLMESEPRPKVNPKPAAPASSPQGPPPETADKTPPAPPLLKLYSHRDKTLAEIRGLHPYLSLTPEGEQLRQISEQIVRKGIALSLITEQINHFLEHGDLPVLEKPEQPVIMIDYNLVNQLELLRKSLNKAENRAKKQGEVKPKTLALIQSRRMEYEALKKKVEEMKKGVGNG